MLTSAPTRMCPVCAGEMPKGGTFCPHYGTPVLSKTQMAQVDAHVRAKVTSELAQCQKFGAQEEKTVRRGPI